MGYWRWAQSGGWCWLELEVKRKARQEEGSCRRGNRYCARLLCCVLGSRVCAKVGEGNLESLRRLHDSAPGGRRTADGRLVQPWCLNRHFRLLPDEANNWE